MVTVFNEEQLEPTSDPFHGDTITYEKVANPSYYKGFLQACKEIKNIVSLESEASMRESGKSSLDQVWNQITDLEKSISSLKGG